LPGVVVEVVTDTTQENPSQSGKARVEDGLTGGGESADEIEAPVDLIRKGFRSFRAVL
jgi:hypothetical protein